MIAVPTVVAVPLPEDGKPQLRPVTGQILMGGQPVSGVRVRVGGYLPPEATNANGEFTVPVDPHRVQRETVRIDDASQAQIGGNPLGDQQREELSHAEGVLLVNYQISDVESSTRADGAVVLSATVGYADGSAPSTVVLYSGPQQEADAAQGEEGYVYEGVLVGIAVDGEPVQPISATWPDEEGRVTLVFPPTMAGKEYGWWQRPGIYFSRIEAKPGGDVDLGAWPR